LKGKAPISAIAEELSILPTQIHQWVAMALDHVERAFEKTAKPEKASQRERTLNLAAPNFWAIRDYRG
jgi:hypothetical protein